MKPICVKCERFMRCTKTGYYFTEGMPIGRNIKPGLVEPELWKPYKTWSGDLFACPDCGATVVVGTGLHPVNECFRDDFEEQRKRIGADQLLVKDC